MSTTHFLAMQLSDDHAKAVAYWASREHKKFAVHVVIGSGKRPTSEHVTFVGARTPQAAIAGAKAHRTKPGLAQYFARLAGPRELGCVPCGAQS